MSEVLLGNVESVIKWIPWRNFRRLNGKRPVLTIPAPISLNSKKTKKTFPKSNSPALLPKYNTLQMPKNRQETNISYFEDQNQTRVTNSYDFNYLAKDTTDVMPSEHTGQPIEISIHGKSPTLFADSKISSNHSHFSLKKKSKNISRNLNHQLFSYQSRSPIQNIKLCSSISRKVLFPPILRNQPFSLTPNPKYKSNNKKSNIRDAIMITETFGEDMWLDSKYFPLIY